MQSISTGPDPGFGFGGGQIENMGMWYGEWYNPSPGFFVPIFGPRNAYFAAISCPSRC